MDTSRNQTETTPSPSIARTASRGPYVAPSLTPLGSVESVTAGPIERGGNLDQLFGGIGGFNAVTDPS